MVRYLTFADLNRKATVYSLHHALNESRCLYASATDLQRITVFLSHKHDEPEELIKQVKGFFAGLGAKTYIDWQDKDMPQITNSETAKKLKKRIRDSNKFVILATPQSINSIWIPWEIGLADQMKGLSNIAILPVVNDASTWDSREYYRLYSRIENVNGEWTVLQPECNYYGTSLKEWLQR